MQKLQVVDVTQGTMVSFAPGFQVADSAGVWNVPGGATLYAPNISVTGPLTLSAVNSALDLPYRQETTFTWQQYISQTGMTVFNGS